MRPSDLPHAVAALVELGQILGRHADAGDETRGTTVAEAALAAARDYQPGQAAARLQPSRGRQVEPVRWGDGTTELVDVPAHDPNGSQHAVASRHVTIPAPVCSTCDGEGMVDQFPFCYGTGPKKPCPDCARDPEETAGA